MNANWNDKFIKEKAYAVDNDRFKDKSFIFAPFPESDQHGFQNGEIRALIKADFNARFDRMANYNVLFPTGFNSITLASFIESKKMYKLLDDQSTDVYYKQMSKLGIGIFDGKCINMRHQEFLALAQNAFIELYERNYIKYKMSSPYYSKENNRIYDYMEAPLGSVKNSMKCFILDIDGLIPDIVKDIESLNIDDGYKKELIDELCPVSVLKLEMMLSNQEHLDIEMENPEYIGGISYIFLNPEFMDIRKYVSHDEYDSVEEYLNTKASLYAYSGLTAKNPLTGMDIPIFISNLYPVGIYLGIPDIDQEDASLVLNEGFDHPVILQDNILINSDILDGCSPEEGRKKLIEAFTDAEIGRVGFVYRNNEILMSSLDPFGALIPFLDDKGNINSLKDYLPYAFSPQFRPVLGDNVLVSGNPIPGTINHLFIEGVAPLLSLIYDDIGSIESLFSSETRSIFERWLPIKSIYIPERVIREYLLMPLIIYNIIKKEVSYSLPNIFSNVSIIKRSLDIHHNSLKRKNNNLINMDIWIDKYGPDAIRDLVIRTKDNEEMIFDPYRLEDTVEYLKRIESSLLGAINEDVRSLDYHFHQFSSIAYGFLEKNDYISFMKLLDEFNEKVLFSEIISKNQALSYIRIIYVVYPYLAEELYSKIFNGRYSIVNEGWPTD